MFLAYSERDSREWQGTLDSREYVPASAFPLPPDLPTPLVINILTLNFFSSTIKGCDKKYIAPATSATRRVIPRRAGTSSHGLPGHIQS